MYKTKTTEIATVVFRTTDSAWIPCDEANADYRDFLAWVAAGNTAEEWQPEDVD